MLVIIFSGLAILPLLIICFGGLFLRSYMSRRTMLTMMLVGVSALIVELFNLYQLVHMHIDLRQWIFISDSDFQVDPKTPAAEISATPGALREDAA